MEKSFFYIFFYKNMIHDIVMATDGVKHLVAKHETFIIIWKRHYLVV